MELAPDGEFAGKVQGLCDRASLSIPFHWDRLFGPVIAAGDPEQEISGTGFAGAVADPDFHRGFGGIRIQMNLIDPNRGGGAELDFSNHTIPDRLGVFDVGVGSADIELLAVVDAEEEVVFSWGNRGEIEFVGGAEGVPLADLFSVQPEPAFPDHPFQKECDAFSFPLFRNFDGTAVPGGADIGKLACEAGETGLADFRFGAARGTESGLIRCARE